MRRIPIARAVARIGINTTVQTATFAMVPARATQLDINMPDVSEGQRRAAMRNPGIAHRHENITAALVNATAKPAATSSHAAVCAVSVRRLRSRDDDRRFFTNYRVSENGRASARLPCSARAHGRENPCLHFEWQPLFSSRPVLAEFITVQLQQGATYLLQAAMLLEIHSWWSVALSASASSTRTGGRNLSRGVPSRWLRRSAGNRTTRPVASKV